jgi:hypothetical protein
MIFSGVGPEEKPPPQPRTANTSNPPQPFQWTEECLSEYRPLVDELSFALWSV